MNHGLVWSDQQGVTVLDPSAPSLFQEHRERLHETGKAKMTELYVELWAHSRSQSKLPIGLGYVEGVTHDYVRNSTTTLFAALVFASEGLVVDYDATYMHPKIRQWLAAQIRYHMYYTPTYSSWLDQLEIWFNLIAQQAIQRGTFHSVKDLTKKIDVVDTQHNPKSKSFA